MKPLSFAEQNVIFAKAQPEYQVLPAHVAHDPCVTVTSCWELSIEEIEQLVKTRKLWLQQLTFGSALQPQLPSVEKPPL